jgi:hypothetical protein
VAAPAIRFGNFNDAAASCFTEKELADIYGGESADLSFSFQMNDEPEDEDAYQMFLANIPPAEEGAEEYQEGVYFQVEALKSLGDQEEIPFSSFNDDVEIQLDIPLYLKWEDRDFALLTNVMGACELLSDTDEDAETLTINTHNIGSALLLYRERAKEPFPDAERARITYKHLIGIGIILLVALWFVIDRIHKTK